MVTGSADQCLPDVNLFLRNVTFLHMKQNSFRLFELMSETQAAPQTSRLKIWAQSLPASLTMSLLYVWIVL